MADEAVKIIDLGPGTLEQGWYRHDTPEQAIVNTYQNVLSHTVSEMLLEDDFTAAQVPVRMLEAFDAATPTVVMETLEDERLNWGADSHFKPLSRYVGQLALDTETDTHLAASPEFSGHLRQQLEALPYGFSVLDSWRSKLAAIGYLDLARKIHGIADGEVRSSQWANEVFAILKEATENSDNYTLPIDDAEALALVCFLPGHARALTRRIIVNNALFAQTKVNLGNINGEAEETVLGALQRFLQIDALAGAFENGLRKYLNEDNNVTIGMLAAESLDALGYIRTLLDEGRGSRVAEAWQTARNNLNEIVDRATADNPAGYWAAIDTGHGLHNFSHYDLYDVFTYGESLRHEFGKAPKDGSRAVILEDDDAQMAIWQRSIERHTRASVAKDLCFIAPEGIEELIDDDSVGLFVLDLQNGDDNFAGMRVAEKVLRVRGTKLFREPADARENMPKTDIILWSASPALLAEAERYLKPLIEELKEFLGMHFGCSYFGGGGSSSSVQILTVDLRLKGWETGDVGRVE